MATAELAFVGLVAGGFGAALATLLDGVWWRKMEAAATRACKEADRAADCRLAAELAEMAAGGYLRQVRESLADRDDLVVLVSYQPKE